MTDQGSPEPVSDQKQKPITQGNTESISFPKPPSQGVPNGSPEVDYPPLTAPVIPVAPPRTSDTAPILFYRRNAPYYEFTNFSPHDVIYKEKRYPTSEHLFQAFKFLDDHPEIAERIRNCERPMLAFDEAHQHQDWVRSDWRQVNVEKMEIALYHKFTRHADLKALLLGTGDAELVEDSPRDYFWGIGVDHSGRNELGKALMRLRAELREERSGPYMIPTARKNDIRLSAQDLPSLVPTHSANEPRFQEHEDPNKLPGSRHLAQCPSIASTQPFSDVNGPPCCSMFASGNRASNLRMAPPQDSGLCEFCQVRPKFQTFPYCGRTCATEATKMCSFCRSKPRFGMHPFCSRTCAAKAGGSV